MARFTKKEKAEQKKLKMESTKKGKKTVKQSVENKVTTRRKRQSSPDDEVRSQSCESQSSTVPAVHALEKKMQILASLMTEVKDELRDVKGNPVPEAGSDNERDVQDRADDDYIEYNQRTSRADCRIDEHHREAHYRDAYDSCHDHYPGQQRHRRMMSPEGEGRDSDQGHHYSLATFLPRGHDEEQRRRRREHELRAELDAIRGGHDRNRTMGDELRQLNIGLPGSPHTHGSRDGLHSSPSPMRLQGLQAYKKKIVTKPHEKVQSGRNKTADAGNLKYDIPWPQFKILRSGTKNPTFDQLDVFEFIRGYCLIMLDLKDFNQENFMLIRQMITHISQLMLDSESSSWSQILAYHYEVLHGMEVGQHSWFDNDVIDNLRLDHALRKTDRVQNVNTAPQMSGNRSYANNSQMSQNRPMASYNANAQPLFQMCQPWQQGGCPNLQDHDGLTHACSHCWKKGYVKRHPESQCSFKAAQRGRGQNHK